MRPYLNAFDVYVFHLINGHAGQLLWLDAGLKFAARDAPYVYAMLFIVSWFALPWTEERRRNALLVAVAGGVLAIIVNFIIGHTWPRTRPFLVPGLHDHLLLAHPPDASFPSDHVGGGFAVSAALWGRGQTWLSWTVTLFSCVVMVARVYVGVHWPTDVLGGMVTGILCGRLVLVFTSPLRCITRIGMSVFRMGPREKY